MESEAEYTVREVAQWERVEGGSAIRPLPPCFQGVSL
jgi:hypothetical protein